MAFIREYEEPRGEHALCRVLRNKALIVTGVRDENEHANEVGSGHCWCNLTQHVVGPDGLAVSPADCRPGRSCYRTS